MNVQEEFIEQVADALADLAFSIKCSVIEAAHMVCQQEVCGEVPPISPAQLRVIFHIRRFGPSTISDIAGGLGVSLAAASQLVDKLVQEGWIPPREQPERRARYERR